MLVGMSSLLFVTRVTIVNVIIIKPLFRTLLRVLIDGNDAWIIKNVNVPFVKRFQIFYRVLHDPIVFKISKVYYTNTNLDGYKNETFT